MVGTTIAAMAKRTSGIRTGQFRTTERRKDARSSAIGLAAVGPPRDANGIGSVTSTGRSGGSIGPSGHALITSVDVSCDRCLVSAGSNGSSLTHPSPGRRLPLHMPFWSSARHSCGRTAPAQDQNYRYGCMAPGPESASPVRPNDIPEARNRMRTDYLPPVAPTPSIGPLPCIHLHPCAKLTLDNRAQT